MEEVKHCARIILVVVGFNPFQTRKDCGWRFKSQRDLQQNVESRIFDRWFARQTAGQLAMYADM